MTNNDSCLNNYIVMKIKDKTVQCLVDTGSVSTVISHTFALKLGLNIRQCVNSNALFSANGAPLRVIGMVDVIFYLKGLRIPHTLRVVEGLAPHLVLGIDFMKANKVTVNYVDGTVRFYEDLLVIPLQGYDSRDNCAFVSQTVCIPKYAEAIIPVTVPRQYANTCLVLESLHNRYDLVAVAGSLNNADGRKAVVKVLNYKPHSVVLKKHTKIASVVPPNSITAIQQFTMDNKEQDEIDVPCQEQPVEVLEEFAKTYKFDINPKLTSEQRLAVLKVMYQYKSVFARGLQDVKIFRGIQLDLDLKNPNVKSYTRQYPLSEADAQEVDRQIQQMCEVGLVRENSDCSWNSPVFVVAKKDNTKRMVVDLRKVNTLLKPIITLLPKIDELMQQITAFKPSHLSSFDFFKGYYQVPLSKRSQPLTAFVSPKTGISYCHVTLPMGLAASPAAFIQMMSKVFKDKTRWFFLFSYVDDLILVSTSFSEHLKHLKEVLHNLLINNLVIIPTKTSIAYSEIEYLGYTVNQHGI